jgi:hypothetical protein
VFVGACGDPPPCGDACRTCTVTCCDQQMLEISERYSIIACEEDARTTCDTHDGVLEAFYDEVKIPNLGDCG